MGVKIGSSAIVGGGDFGSKANYYFIIIVGVKIGSSTLMGMICSSVILGVKIGGSVIVHPFPKCTCSQEGNAQGKDNFPNSEIQIILNVSKFY